MKYPVYVPSRGRARPGKLCTADVLFDYDIPFTFVVDPSEQEEYYDAWPDTHIITPARDNMGIGMARQVALQDARENSHTAIWQLDDDIRGVKEGKDYVHMANVMDYFEERLENEQTLGIISPQFAQVIWRQKELDTVNGQCPCVMTLSRTNLPINYDTELPLCEDLDWMFKFIKYGYDCIMDNRYGFEVQKYGIFAGKVGGVEYRDAQVDKAERILNARYPGINRRFGEKFRTSWKEVKKWRLLASV